LFNTLKMPQNNKKVKFEITKRQLVNSCQS